MKERVALAAFGALALVGLVALIMLAAWALAEAFGFWGPAGMMVAGLLTLGAMHGWQASGGGE